MPSLGVGPCQVDQVAGAPFPWEGVAARRGDRRRRGESLVAFRKLHVRGNPVEGDVRRSERRLQRVPVCPESVGVVVDRVRRTPAVGVGADRSDGGGSDRSDGVSGVAGRIRSAG